MLNTPRKDLIADDHLGVVEDVFLFALKQKLLLESLNDHLLLGIINRIFLLHSYGGFFNIYLYEDVCVHD